MTNLEKLKELINKEINKCEKLSDVEYLISRLKKDIFDASGINEFVKIWETNTLYTDIDKDAWGEKDFEKNNSYFIYKILPECDNIKQYIEITNDDLSSIKTTYQKNEREVYYDYEEAMKTKNKLNERYHKNMESWSIGKVGAKYDE